MNDTAPKPRSRRAEIAILAIALVVPFVWMHWMNGGRTGWHDAQFSVRLALLSGLFWGWAALRLTAPGARLGVGWAVRLGAASPILCLLIAWPLGLVLLPFELLVGSPGVMCTIGGYGWLALIRFPHLIFPVGIAMGLVAWWIATRSAAGGSVGRTVGVSARQENATPAG